jgi:predicted nucleic acid-binding Zn ribbon protein
VSVGLATVQPFREGRQRKSPSAFCPACYSEIPAAAVVCPYCGASLEEWQRRSYAEKLLHPLADVRMRVIIALGLLREKWAEAALVECALRHPIDVVEGHEIVNSLRLIAEGGSGLTALRTLVDKHPARPVRRAAREAIAKLVG